MHAYLNDDNSYTHFEACNPFEVLIQTQNKALFSNPVTIQNLFTITKTYARTICPQVEHIIFSATDSPSLDDSGIFFQKTFYKDDLSDAWIEDSNTSFNYVLNPSKNEETFASADKSYRKIETTDGLQEYVIHISDKTNNRVLFVDKPYLMKTTQNSYTLTLKPGWYKVNATLIPMDDLEKKRTGISLREEAAIIDIKSAKICKDSNCY